MQHIPQPHEIYRHFKGNTYQIITIAEHSETGEMLVIYQAMYGNYKTYARSMDMFLEKLDKEKYPQATQEYRFEVVSIAAKKPEIEPAGEVKKAEIESLREVVKKAEIERSKEVVKKAEIEPAKKLVEELAIEPEGVLTNATAIQSTDEEEEQALNIDPQVLKFLDADSYEERLNILTGIHHRITDDMINVMAIATDIEVKPGDIEERYVELRNCLLKLEKFECNRLR
ncbi:uncharacterized protein DUF1653 [Kineothrix alysoides]|uniref:Uncharacterized protein DUF1653 n=1 Tax=Kineothrix alysoides TaxID=1469948 RepID=A0A4V2QCK1_9FIRM|nr:DUF1653 domain-containing protein [Kineothrix alysoides]TCL60597.1 uncharacterized protein DUF1653 [Kineothrix alysoides]